MLMPQQCLYSSCSATVDFQDVCPFNPLINKTDFGGFSYVAFKVITSRLVYPLWIVNDNGAEIVETGNMLATVVFCSVKLFESYV
jgi:hypothetical protein